jgi:biopolymer transport protein ExbD
MRMRSIPDAHEIGVNVTPLIDIVMCLIIFFMLVARIGVDTGGDHDIVVPASFLGVDLKDLGNTLTLNVTNGANLGVGQADPLITCLLNGQRREIKIHSDFGGHDNYPLYDALRHFKEANSDFKVIIRADQNTEYQYLQPVLAECTRAGVSYDFATQRGEAEPQ